MITYMLRTNPYEASQIVKGNKMYVLRTDYGVYEPGTLIEFLVIDNKKTIPHPINANKYKITVIERGDPIRDGVVLIGFKKL